MFVNGVFQLFQGFIHRYFLELGSCGIKVPAAAQFFGNQLYIDGSVGAGGNDHIVTDFAQGKGSNVGFGGPTSFLRNLPSSPLWWE